MNEPSLTPVPRVPTMMGAMLGNYRVTGALSSGGMGRVFRAQHELLGRPAAVKLLRPELTQNAELVQRFFNEAKAAAAINHPGIVEIYDFGYAADGQAYLVMELLEGRTLARALAAAGRFAEHEVATIARGLASTLKAAHARNIIHRDLKPENIFLVPDLEGPTGAMRVKVLDFGVAKLETGSSTRGFTQTGILLGTVVYMAPEQARAAGDIDQRADLYSLGCILYELLTGRPPFVAEGAGEIIAMQMFTPPDPLRAQVPDISVGMEQIVLRLLAKEPSERFQTANELLKALDQIGYRGSAQHAVMAAPSGRAAHVVDSVARPAEDLLVTERTAPPVSSSRLAWFALAVVVVLVAAVVAIAIAMRPGGTESTAEPTPTPTSTPSTPTPPPPTPTPTPPTTPPPPTVTPATPAVPTSPRPPTPRPMPATPVSPSTTSTAPPPTGSATVAKPRGPTTDSGLPIEPQL